MWVLFHQIGQDMLRGCFHVIEYKNRPMTLTFYCCTLIMDKGQNGIFHRQQVIISSHDTIDRTRIKFWHIVDSYCIGTYYIRIHSGSSITLDTVASSLPRPLNISTILISVRLFDWICWLYHDDYTSFYEFPLWRMYCIMWGSNSVKVFLEVAKCYNYSTVFQIT